MKSKFLTESKFRLGRPRRVKFRGQKIKYAGMAELADAYDSGSYFRKEVQVQFLLPAPNGTFPNLFLIGDGFGFTVLFNYPNFNSKK